MVYIYIYIYVCILDILTRNPMAFQRPSGHMDRKHHIYDVL